MSAEARITAARHLAADFDGAVDAAFRLGEPVDFYQWANRLAGTLRTVCQLADDTGKRLAGARLLNHEMAGIFEEIIAVGDFDLSGHADALLRALDAKSWPPR